MTNQGDKTNFKVREILQDKFVAMVADDLDDEIARMIRILEIADQFNASYQLDKDDKLVVDYKKVLYDLIQEKCVEQDPVRFSEIYSGLITSLNQAFETVPEKTNQVQSKERFFAQTGDSFFLKIAKSFKRLSFNVTKIPARIGNVIKSNKQPINYWNQEVLLRNLTRKYFHAELISSLKPVTDLIFKSKLEAYSKLKKWESDFQKADVIAVEPQITAIRESAESIKTTVKNEVANIMDQLENQFRDDLEKAGTMELPGRNFKTEKVTAEIEKAETNWNSHFDGWSNTFYAFMEKWSSDLDIHILKYNAQVEFGNFQSAQIKKLIEHIEPEINAIQDFIDRAMETLEQDQESIVKELKKIVYQANKTLDQQLVPKLCEKLASRNITGLINKLEIDIRQHVDLIAQDHVLLKSDSFQEPVSKDELNKVSLNELIKFEILSVFQSDLDKIKNGLFTSLEKTTLEVSDLDHIITFSVNSAISTSADEGRNEQEVVSIAMEGLKRAGARLADVRKKLEESLAGNILKLDEAIGRFCESIMKLTVHENVQDLKLRITKAKATLQAEEVRKELQQEFEEGKRNFTSFLKKTYNQVNDGLAFLRDKFILTRAKPVLTRDVSDFLLESQSAIDKLPLIYRRLYKIEPLDDLELFEGREAEIEAFKEAYGNWNKNRYVTTIVLGEKWGGFTTFLNYVIKKGRLAYSIKRWSIDESICRSEDFIRLLSEVINQKGVSNQENLIAYLNGGSKQIIVLENIQNLYLRKTDGFHAMNALFEIMSATCRNVFWIATSTIYCWNYLTKSINIQDFFTNQIEMKSFSKEQITNVIWKRNRISGFNIRFLVEEEHKHDKKFQKLNEEQQQVYLKEQFFDGLNTFSKSNVSLALKFWLMSTREVDEHTITIGKFNQPNLNFLKVLSMDKIYILLALVLHDGLNAKEISEVLNENRESCTHTLFALQKDGIIVFNDEQFMINTVVYRSVIAVLKAKNLIH
ncbi:MAG: hypothetical protein AAFQ94_12730 [Bacteroidota bacterium]